VSSPGQAPVVHRTPQSPAPAVDQKKKKSHRRKVAEESRRTPEARGAAAENEVKSNARRRREMRSARAGAEATTGVGPRGADLLSLARARGARARCAGPATGGAKWAGRTR
jgi:hypothetical protein